MGKINIMAEEAPKMNWLDRAVAAVFPERGFKRAHARAAMEFFGYDAAHPGRLRGGSGGMSKNAAAESPRMAADRIRVMWDARDTVRNDPLIGGIIDRVVMYICGKIAYQPRTGSHDLDRVYRDFFYDWCERSDLTGRHRLREQAALATKGMIVDGDHGFVKVRQGNELRLQHIESDRIGDPLKMMSNTNEAYIQGFNLNNFGQIVSVDVYKRTRTAQYYFDKKVPADQFIHLAIHQTSDQYRPASHLVRVLPHGRDLRELIGFAKQQQKFASMFAGFLKPIAPYNAPGATVWDEAPAPGQLGKIQAEAGLVKQIPQGYGEIQYAPTCENPNGAFITLFETVIRLMASGLILPYGFIWDMAVFGGVTARIELTQVDRAIARYRQHLVDRMLEQVKNDVLSLGIATRAIPAHPNYRMGKWNFGGKLTGDYGHDTQADLAKLSAGLTTATTLADQDGEEWEEMVTTAAKEFEFMRDVAGESRVPIELLSNRFPNATQLLAAAATPPQPPPQDLISQKGDAATKQLIDILTSVGEGKMDHDSAVEQIINIFGVLRVQAEAMVPDGPGMAARSQAAAASQAARSAGKPTRKLYLRRNGK
jgi:capsid protein